MTVRSNIRLSNGMAKRMRGGRATHPFLRGDRAYPWFGAAGSLLFLALFLLTSCSLKIGDHVDTSEPVHATSVGPTCLETAFNTIENYPSGHVSADQVGSAWNCAIDALKTFSKVAQGKDASSFTAASLRTFLEQNFLSQTKISDRLLGQVMLIKQLLLGGDADRLTKDEIERAQAIFATLRDETVRVLPHIRILTMKDEPAEIQAHPEKVEAAIGEISRSLGVISNVLSQSRSPYDLANLEVLLEELQALYSNSSGWTGPQWLIQKLPVIYHAKAFLVRPNGQVITPTEWTELFQRAGELYAIFLRAHYLMYQQELLRGVGLEQLRLATESAFTTLHAAVVAKSDRKIPYELLEPLVDDMIELKIIDWEVKASTWKGLLRVVFDHVFNPPARGAGARTAIGGLTEANLALFKQNTEGWIACQKDWGTLQQLATAQNPQFAGAAIPLPLVSELWSGITSNAPTQHQDLTLLFQRRFPLDYTTEGGVAFEGDRSKVFVDQEMFDSINWKQTFIRAVVMGYSSAPEKMRYTGVTKDEFHHFFIDLKALGVDLNFLDPNDDDVWSSVFSELNMFTLSADGGDPVGAQYVSFNEGVDFISNAVSSPQSAHVFYADLLDHCAHESPDVYGIPRWPASCYRERFKLSFTRIYRLFPKWVKMASAYSADDMSAFQQDFEKAARKDGISEELVESNDIDRGTMVMHYIESLYVRFDQDHSETLNAKEATLAYPLLRDVLSDAVGSKNDGMLLSVFTYLMKYGAPPTSLTDKAFFELYWKNSPSRWNFEADRHQLLKIVGNLNSKAKQ